MIFSTEPPEDLCTHTKNHIDSKIPLDFFPKHGTIELALGEHEC